MTPALPASYAATLADRKLRIQTEHLRKVISANNAMMLLYDLAIGQQPVAQIPWGQKTVLLDRRLPSVEELELELAAVPEDDHE